MASQIQNFTIFLKYQKFVKKICIALSTVSELYDIAMQKFEAEIGDSFIELYLEDKEFGIHCEFEELQQLYHGAIVEVRQKGKAKSKCNSSSSSRYLMSLGSDSNSLEKEISRSSSNTSNSSSEQRKVTNSKSSISPTWSSIVSSNLNGLVHDTCASNWSSFISNDEPTPTPRSTPTTTSTDTSTTRTPTPQPEISVDNSQFMIPRNRYYVLLSGVPFTSTHQDIISFFDPLQIYNANSNGIFFVINSQRHRIGQVFVVFSNKTTYESAFELNGHYFAGRAIQISECTLNDFKRCVKISNGINMRDFVETGAKRNHFVMKLKGFSFDIDEYRVREWLKRKSIVPLQVHIIYDYRNRNSGIAYLEFKCKQNATRVFQLNNEYLGCRYINVFISTLNELRIHLAQVIGCPLPQNLNPYLNCLRIDGVPHRCQEKDVVAFFEDALGVIPKQLYIKCALNIAYVEFKTQFECQLALTRNQTRIVCSKDNASSLIALMQVSKYELRSCVGDIHVSNSRDSSNSNSSNSRDSDDNINVDMIGVAALHHQCHKTKRRRKHKQKHIVSIRGIPFDSDKQSVLDFLSNVEFKGYESTMDRKSLRFIKDHKGRFSGQATVVFRDRQQATQVVNQLDRKYIGSRYVLLRLF